LATCIGQGFAQYTDVEAWLGAGIRQSFRSDWTWSLQWENRWNQDLHWHEQGLIDVAVDRKLSKHWEVSAQWRFSERQEMVGAYTSQRRAALRLNGSWKAGAGDFALRIMGTEAWSPMRSSGEFKLNDWEPTTRIRLGYGQRVGESLKADVSWEWFRRLDGDMSERWQASLEKEIAKDWDVELAYLWGNPWREVDPWGSHVFRFQTRFTLPDGSKGKPKFIPPARVFTNGKPARPAHEDCLPCALTDLYIQEVHAKGDPADYIEIVNKGGDTCDLLGWQLTDDLSAEGFTFGAVSLAPGAVWLGYEDGKNSFRFGIAAEGESLFLIQPDGLDSKESTLLPTLENRAQGLDSAGIWRFVNPTPGAPNETN
jgi:hypothetical protein